MLEDLKIGEIALAPIITGIVELAKQAGMPTQYARFLDGALCVLAFGGMVWLTRDPSSLDITVLFLKMIIIFLTSTGVYHILKK